MSNKKKAEKKQKPILVRKSEVVTRAKSKMGDKELVASASNPTEGQEINNQSEVKNDNKPKGDQVENNEKDKPTSDKSERESEDTESSDQSDDEHDRRRNSKDKRAKRAAAAEESMRVKLSDETWVGDPFLYFTYFDGSENSSRWLFKF